jgi:serine protein kinase
MGGSNNSILTLINQYQNTEHFRKLNWEGSFQDYLEIVQQNPRVTRSAFQRVYDMILSYGKEEYAEYKRKIVRYNFFKDSLHAGKDAVYGLDIHLSKMVDIFKAAAQRYGTERRVLLLHGPVGSSKSTIARLLKKGLEEYSKTPDGALYTFGWSQLNLHDDSDASRWSDEMPCPMHEEPLHLIPVEFRPQVLAELNKSTNQDYTVSVD